MCAPPPPWSVRRRVCFIFTKGALLFVPTKFLAEDVLSSHRERCLSKAFSQCVWGSLLSAALLLPRGPRAVSRDDVYSLVDPPTNTCLRRVKCEKPFIKKGRGYKPSKKSATHRTRWIKVSKQPCPQQSLKKPLKSVARPQNPGKSFSGGSEIRQRWNAQKKFSPPWKVSSPKNSQRGKRNF